MPVPVIYYIRHGETAWNAEGRFQGSRDIPLNDLGRTQAVTAGGILADLMTRNGHEASALPFVASPLGRARSTMELVRGTMQLPPGEYDVDHRLREHLARLQEQSAATLVSRSRIIQPGAPPPAPPPLPGEGQGN